MRYSRTAQAEEDLLEIWLHIAERNPVAADKLLDRIDDARILLAERPDLGPERPDIAPALRYFVRGKYLILYRKRVRSIEIVRVIHGARRLTDLGL